MGCWDETCGLSGLPIEYDDKTLLFPLSSSPLYESGQSGFSYPTGLWQPMTLPFYGTYNSYGALENPTCINLGLAQKVFWDYGIEWSESTFDELERGKLSGRLGWSGENRLIGQMLVRQDVWEVFLNLRPEHRTDCRNGSDRWIEYELSHDDTSDMRGHMAMEAHFEGLYPLGASLFFALFHSSLPDLRWFSRGIREAIRNKEVPQDTLQTIAHEYADVVHVNNVMHHARRAWGPQTGKGSQYVEWEMHQEIANKMSAIAAVAIAQNEEENGGE